jgi:hypothetical protein
MYEVIGLKDFGTWLQKGRKTICPDTHVMSLAMSGHLRVIRYHLNHDNQRKLKQSLPRLMEQQRCINMKVKAYKEYLKNGM